MMVFLISERRTIIPFSTYYESRHGESAYSAEIAYVIEQGWNLVVNRPLTSGRT